MKKGVIALIIVLAVVVLISPGIVGRMAESSMDDQIQWAAGEDSDVIITTERFDRGWFSSEGVHRVEIGQTGLGADIREAMDLSPGDPSPALVINTTLDHGLIPVTSVSREEGSLAPGLGRAVSTLSVELPGGEGWSIPGVVYTSIGLGGGMSSNYFLEAGSYEDVRWGAGDFLFEANASNGNIVFEGGIDSISVQDSGESVEMSMLEIETDMEMSEYGFYTGDLRFSIDSVSIEEGFQTMSLGPMNVESTTELDGDRVDSDVKVDMAMAGMPMGDMNVDLDLTFDGLDAAAFGRVNEALNNAPESADPMMAFASMEQDFADLVAAGLTLRIDRLDVNLPQGAFKSEMEITVPESDRDSFVWTSVLLAMEASADVTIPSGLFETIAMMNPDAQMAVAMGILRQDGDDYVMEAEYKQGLLTVNGAPMPIPLPGM